MLTFSPVAAARINSLREFWPYYLSQRRKRLTRSLHFFGTDAAAIGIVVAVLQRSPRLLLTALGRAYGLAWVGHLLIEHNRPATFQYPFWSLLVFFLDVLVIYALAVYGGKQME